MMSALSPGIPVRRVLVYSTFPPKHCGIARYAEQHVQFLRKLGYAVSIMSPDVESEASLRVDLNSPRSLLKAIELLWRSRFDEIHVHYTRDFFYPSPAKGPARDFLARMLQPLLLLALGARAGSGGSLIFHEALLGLGSHRAMATFRACGFALFKNLVFHTATERKLLMERYPRLVRADRARLEAHERYMQLKYVGSKQDARRDLGIPAAGVVFLSIGFIQPNKGFHLAIEAFMRMPARGNVALYIVGSLRTEDAATLAYRDRLRTAARGRPDIVLLEAYVDDVGFDRWITAADVVILPYQEISSSSVGARVQLVGRTMIVNRATHLLEQFERFTGEISTFSTVDELSASIIRLSDEGTAH